jgi:hypothetical protein
MFLRILEHLGYVRRGITGKGSMRVRVLAATPRSRFSVLHANSPHPEDGEPGMSVM